MCTWKNSSLELETFAPSILHKLAIIKLPNGIGEMDDVIDAYLVGRFSDFLLQINKITSGAYLDLFISALSTQYFLLPAAAGHSQGVYTSMGLPVKWQAYMYINGICLAGVSILSFFENRFTAVVRGRRSSILNEKRRLAYIICNYIFSFSYILPITFTPPEQSYGKSYVRAVSFGYPDKLTQGQTEFQILPCVPQEILDHPDFFVYATDITLLTCIISFGASVTTLQCIYFFVRIIMYLSSRKAKSLKTYKLQLHFFIALSIQILIPLVAIIGPVCYIVFAFVAGHYDQALNNIFLNIIAVHGLLSSVVMMGVHKPYREAVQSLLCWFHKRKERRIEYRRSINVTGSVIVLSGSRA
ncbi:unnamed protein product [Caenorhabditis brenneri]